MFARIEHHHAPRDLWVVRSRDGLVSEYGGEACIRDPADANRRFSWLLNRTTDSFGNTMVYTYERDPVNQDGPRHWDQMYPSTIRYCNYGPAATEFLYEIRFLYEVRPDPFTEYRAGFEVRTVRRCTAIEMWSHAGAAILVRRYNVGYTEAAGNGVSLLTRIECEGEDNGRRESLPALEFGYTSYEPNRRRWLAVKADGDQLPAESLAGDLQLASLSGNGLPDIVQMHATGTRYWHNRGNLVFDRPRALDNAPAGGQGIAGTGATARIADLTGDGRPDLLVEDDTQSGYYWLTSNPAENTWQRYEQRPPFGLSDPETQLLDLNGDGVTDALRSSNRFELYYNDPHQGWVTAEKRERADLDVFPDVSLSDGRVRLADMSGDGLQDIVLVHNGRIDYWPYMGHGRWGKRITMRNSPRFDDGAAYGAQGFDESRLLIGDVDGDGVADLVYFGAFSVKVWINQSGNAWSDAVEIRGTPSVGSASSVRLADLLGNGTDGIVWSVNSGLLTRTNYRFLDLTGGTKPYLLNRIDNHMGGVTEIEYVSSTHYYQQDDADPATRWRTTLPFPVMVVSSVVATDAFAGSRAMTSWRYHHGYWDGAEREFRGFGLVEQFDTEVFEHTGLDDRTHYSPPTLSRTWFHQGPIGNVQGGWIEPDFRDQYWSGDAGMLGPHGAGRESLPSTDADGRRDAFRSLRSRILRSELYAIDGSNVEHRPLTVVEHRYRVRTIAGSNGSEPVFYPYLDAQRTTRWERGTDPLTTFIFNPEYDSYGQALQRIEVAVPRGRNPLRHDEAAPEPYLGAEIRTQYAYNDAEDQYMVDRVSRTESREIVNDGKPAVEDFLRNIVSGSTATRLYSQTLTFFDGEAFVGLPFAQTGRHGMAVRTEMLRLDESLILAAYGRTSSDAQMPPVFEPSARSRGDEYPSGVVQTLLSINSPARPGLRTGPLGYAVPDGGEGAYAAGFFVAGSRFAYDFQDPVDGSGCGQVTAEMDPTGCTTRILYDRYRLFPVEVRDAAEMATRAAYDYRVLQPSVITDANGNDTRVTYSPLGFVAGIAVMGKADEPEGDTPDLPSVAVEYDLNAPDKKGRPVSVRIRRRIHHVRSRPSPDDDAERSIESIQFFDGAGRMLQSRQQAEDLRFGNHSFGGEVLPPTPGDSAGTAADVIGNAKTSEANVSVSGWQVYDNKGRVVQRYEPFFSNGWEFSLHEAERALSRRFTMFYDAGGRMVRTVARTGRKSG